MPLIDRPATRLRLVLSPLAATACLLAVAALSLVAAPDARAQQGQGTISINPSYISAHVERGSKLPAITVRNTTAERLMISVQPLPATQDLSGLPDYSFDPASRQVGDHWFSVGPRRFTLAPGSSRDVRARVNVCSQSGLGTYGVISFEARAANRKDDASGQLQPAIRLATTMLLSYDRVCIDGALTSLRAEQAAAQTLRFVATVHNDGNLHAKPRSLQLQIRDDAGKVVLERNYARENVLPDARREFAIEFATPLLPAGDYSAVTRLDLGGVKTQKTTEFTLTAPNTIPTPDLQINEFAPPEPEPNQGFSAAATIANEGSGSGSATAKAYLYRSGSDGAIESDEEPIDDLAADSETEVEFEFAGLAAGNYRIELVVSDPDGRQLDRQIVGFVVEQGPSMWQQTKNWLAGHVLAILAVGLLILVAIIVGTAVYVRRKLSGYEASAGDDAPDASDDE